MAWTTPRTWTSGELVTDTIMNAHIRDNQKAMSPHLVVRKSSDESVTSSTTFQNDDELLMALAANTNYYVRLILIWQANPSTGDLKIQFTMPTSCSVFLGGLGGSVAATVWNVPMYGTSSPTSTGDFLGLNTGTDPRVLPIEGVVINGANTGNLQMQWAQNSSSSTATTIKANSTLWAMVLA